MPVTTKQPIPSPSPWARSWYLYQNVHAHRCGQDKDHGLGKGEKPQSSGPRPSIAKAIFEAEWEAFKESTDSNKTIDHVDDLIKDGLDREPGWPKCPVCDEGHDPCMPCFS